MLIGCGRELPMPLLAHPSICPLLAWQKYDYTCKKKSWCKSSTQEDYESFVHHQLQHYIWKTIKLQI